MRNTESPSPRLAIALADSPSHSGAQPLDMAAKSGRNDATMIVARFATRRVVGLFAAFGVGLFAACGEEIGVDTAAADASASAQTDTAVAETAEPVDTMTVGNDTVVALDLANGGDAAAACPGAPGCACKEAKDCDGGFCITTAKGQVCAKKCSSNECAADEKCVQAGTADVINICVPKYALLCNPCSANSQCQNQANPEAKCIDGGNNGAFCGNACAGDSDCAQTYTCSDVKDIGGAATKQCVPKTSAACSCNAYAIAQQLSTKCFVATGDGKCEGKRTCLAAAAPGAPAGGGLSACLAPDVKAEECNGKDDDCDGQTDEATCSDNSVCTDDLCDKAAGCKNPNNTAVCTDDTVCTEGDKCANGKCVAGVALVCTDKNSCTKDSCDAKTGCQFTNDDLAVCNSDDNPCTLNDACKAGACVAGAAKACTNEDPCLQGKCDIADGSCKYKFQADSACNDGNPCTVNEKCATDACKGAALSCDDKNTCTSDSCDPKSGCIHTHVAGACDDENKCTDKDACADGKCKGTAVDVVAACDDKNPCTTDTCDIAKGCQATAATGAKCDDGNLCTEGDACKNGKCAADVNNCACQADSECKDDGNLCNGSVYCDKAKQPFVCKVKESTIVACDTSLNGECQINECDPATGKCGFAKKPDFLPCNADSSLCTVGDVCADGKCKPGAVQTCDDKNPCTDDSCDAKLGCLFKANTTPCNADDNLCSENDTCALGSCVAGKAKACDSGDQCYTGKCSIIDGKCKYLPANGAPCNDSNPCTLNDACASDNCSGSAANCDDKNPCTGDACDSKTGCVHNPVPANCDDSNKCTVSDACKDGKCGGAPIDASKVCNDDNACTNDACDVITGCVNKGTSGAACDDGNTCTQNDLCESGKCAPGNNTCSCQADADCKDDGNLCNGVLFCDKAKLPYQCKIKADSVISCDDSLNTQCSKVACDPIQGKCIVTNSVDGAACDADKNACTDGDACKTGKCDAGALKKCDDKNECTDDSCDASAGCKFVNNSAACDADSNQCTQADKCASGACGAGAVKKCDDSQPCTQDSCDTKIGNCLYTPIQTTCSDNNICTTGDACGTGATGVYACLAGKSVVCDDKNPCTIDLCDAQKGCQYIVDASVTSSCYTGPSGTVGKGQCKAGKQTCDANGVLGKCANEVLPAAKELCNGIDDNCDTTTDEGCAPTAFAARIANGVVSGPAGKDSVRTLIGGSVVIGPTGGSQNTTANMGFYAWIRKIMGL